MYSLGETLASHLHSLKEPFKSDLYNIEQIKSLGKDKAKSHVLLERKQKTTILKELEVNERILEEAHQLLGRAIDQQHIISPAGVWLLDNFYILIEQIHSLKQDLTEQYLQELPQVTNGYFEGIPRIYDIILELLAHTDSKIDRLNIESIINGYQEHIYLTLGEVWAIPLLLRLAIIENVKRIALAVAHSRIEYDKANEWIETIKSVANVDPRKIIVNLAKIAESDVILSNAFVFESNLLLKTLGIDIITSWLEFYISGQGRNIEEMVYLETQNQAENRISIANCMTSLRFIESMNWREFIEQLSKVDRVFRSVSYDFYPKMDFATRDYYRHEIEKFAKDHKILEIEVAERVVQLAQTAADTYGHQDRRSHVGYYLIDEGVKDLHGAFHARAGIFGAINNFLKRHSLFFYIASFSLITLLVSAFLLRTGLDTLRNSWLTIPFALIVIFCALYSCVELTNHFSTLVVKPKLVPKMEYKDGIPPEAQTLIVIAMLLFNEQEIKQQIKQLETIYLSNLGKNLHFGLMTDWVDSSEELNARDIALFECAAAEITALNQKYKSAGGVSFYLFHRKRTYNTLEKKWMGWERKRGGIMNLFSALLNNDKFDRYYSVIGDKSLLNKFKYAIVLDMDTILPFNAAKKLVAAMDHPLNTPNFDSTLKKVTNGYCILQPSVLVNFPNLNKSRYIKLFGGDTGIDPYSTLTSCLYQDVFKEGSFIGKGIYNIACFMNVVEHRFPENLLLSHDLIESNLARSGTLSDVRIFEDAPFNYLNDVFRIHRWIRGDWQIYEWLGSYARDEKGVRQKNNMSGLAKWKVFDNLRRSLVPLGFLCLIYLGLFFTSAPGFWILMSLLLLIIPQIIASFKDIFTYPKNASFRLHLRHIADKFQSIFGIFAIKVIVLLYEAYIYFDAVIRSLWRMKVSHHRLLEWKTFHETRMENRSGVFYFYKVMFFAPLVSGLTFTLLLLFHPDLLVYIGWLLILWLISPALMYWVSKPLLMKKVALSESDHRFLRVIARKTWGFFETFVGPDTNWLPPDNYQEDPSSVVARRTSPTNIGLSLLTNLSAYEFGYLSLGTYLNRVRNSLSALEKLPRYRGHFYNWYDIDRMQPLNPPYISTVDSGNLVGSLLTLREGLTRLSQDSLNPCRLLAGMQDCLYILMDCLKSARDEQQPKQKSKIRLIEVKISEILDLVSRASESPMAACKLLSELGETLATIKDIEVTSSTPECKQWLSTVQQSFMAVTNEFNALFSWIDVAEDILSIIAKISKEPAQTHNQELQILQKEPKILPILRKLLQDLTLSEILQNRQDLMDSLQSFIDHQETGRGFQEHPDLPHLLMLLKERYSNTCKIINDYLKEAETLALFCIEFSTVEYQFLISHDSNLFSIGFRVDQHVLDNGSYDLLASEARLTSFIAIALGFLDVDHWFALSRQLTAQRGKFALVSWGGTMFEYLLPLLLMPNYPYTLLGQTYKSVVNFQIQYGRKCKVPWGMSEAGYNLTDAAGNYQYQAFGIPGLGIKRGLENDLVVAPYASALALMIAPQRAVDNLRELHEIGMSGQYGFYEAIDYTPSRVPPNKNFAIIRSFMAHHQSMIFLSLANVLLKRPLQELFEEEPHFNSALLLLQEKVPTYVHLMGPRQAWEKQAEAKNEGVIARIIENAISPIPETHLLSNGEYHVMLDNAGSGYSLFQDLALTRWQEDLCQNHWGFFCYVKDLQEGKVGSIGYQPVLENSEHYSAVFSSSSAEFFNIIGALSTHVVIAVSPEDNLELRRLWITNNSSESRTIQLCSYVELALSTAEQDRAHPAFNKLFVETKIDPVRHLILAQRRPRHNTEQNPVAFHFLQVHAPEPLQVTYETSREHFIGRCSNLQRPLAIFGKRGLSNTEGYVLDPIMSISPTLILNPDQQVVIDLFLGISAKAEDAIAIADNYKNRHISDRIFDLAWTSEQLFLRQLNLTESQAQIYQQLGGSIIFSNPLRRAEASTILKNSKAQDSLWALNVSGDLPIMLVFIRNMEGLDFLKGIAKCFEYLQAKGLQFDLIVINKDFGGYRQELQDKIFAILESGARGRSPQKGRPYVFLWEQLSEEHKYLLQAVARVVLSDENGTLEEQVALYRIPEVMPRRLGPLVPFSTNKRKSTKMPHRPLTEFNGYGGFTPDGKEYITFVISGRPTPRPWSNVLANSQFGSVITESGGSYTWDQNAHEYRLTPWYNDWITDATGEAFYLRDDEGPKAWSLTPLPRGGTNYYTCRHGLGYSAFEYAEDGVETEMWVYVHLHAPVKYVLVKVRNRSGRPRVLSLFGYVEWVLGDHRANTCTHVVTRQDLESGAILAMNVFNRDSPKKVAFFTTNRRDRTVTTDRIEFIGRNRSLHDPIALERVRLSNHSGAGLDPCGALHVPLNLNSNEEQQVLFVIGCGADEIQAKQLAAEYDSLDKARWDLEEIWKYWKHMLGVIYLETPDSKINTLANYWLLYQTLACRIWGRSSFYQSGGAFGFRDQLQDVLALVYTEPRITRDHIVNCAARQFLQGDVQHWWHPPHGRGTRTCFSDDYLWLPFTTLYYLHRTGDASLLDEVLPFLEGRPLSPDEESYYDLPLKSSTTGSVYEHCKRAIQYGLKFGNHGLPLMGCGDWNDGMNLVGKGGGESVWLAFFLLSILKDFVPVAQQRADADFVTTCTSAIATLSTNVEKHAWDGDWYKRAFFSDGTPLGSQVNTECRIDSIPQSWAVLSGAGNEDHAKNAINAVYKQLVQKNDRMILLFTPPFENSQLDPGYIKGYPPGIRENGGQYTHAAIWVTMALAQLRDPSRMWELMSYLNPISHGNTPEAIKVYKVEPYVVSADVYSNPVYKGQGGWTWYTGSAGWLYRLIIESILGLDVTGHLLHFHPCLPPDWQDFKVHYRFGSTFYHLHYHQTGSKNSVVEVVVDKKISTNLSVEMVDDHKDHTVEITVE